MCLIIKHLCGDKSSFFLKGLFAFAILFCVTSCYKDDISNLQSQIDQLKAGEIATIDSQIKAINTSITDLKKVDETINGLVGELQKDGEKYANQIADLQAMDGKLDEKIAGLQGYTDEELAKQKDWVEATFATLDQLDSLCAVVTGVDAKIDSVSASLDSLKKELVAGYEESIEKAVTDLETSMKKWVNDQLADYYTIAQTDAALKALEEKYDKADEDLKKEIDEQRAALENLKKDITEAYKKAIEEAITAHDGKINDKIAKDIASAKKELQDQIDAINTEITNIKTRLDALEKELEELARRPQSIVVLAVKPIVLSTGEQASIEFRVNPSTAVFDYSEENCQIELDKAGTVSTKASYVTKPQNYKLVKIEQVVDEETQEVLTGQYRAVIEDTGRSAEYDEMVALVLNTKDAKGNDIQISSSVFEVIGKNFANLPKTGLPVVVINTINAEPIVSKDDWKEGATMSIINADMTFDYQGTLSIKGRGNTTWGYPKKPYALKLDSKSKILGMPKHKRWCLLANWMDRTMIRNAVAFEIARKSPGLDWTPRGEFVEVILNGTHVGNYYLCEQIKVDKNRVDIEELDNTVTEGDGITGGFIMELDTYYDEVNKFKSARRDLPWMFKDPDEVNSAQFTYMQNYVNAMEDALYDDAKFAAREFVNYMDLESFVDWWIVYELAMNGEPNHPKSSYMHKDKNDVIKAGPVWDFDWRSFVPGSTSYFCINNAIYYGRLFEDAGFKSLVKAKWQEQKSKYEEIGQFIDALGAKLSESDELNHIMWPISSTVNGDESMNYEAAVSRLKEAYQNKLNWMDTQISSW